MNGNGELKTEARDVRGFERVENEGSAEVEVFEGADFKVEVSADSNLLQQVSTEREEDRLVIQTKGSFRTRQPIRVQVWMPKLRAASTAGSGELRVQGTKAQRPLRLESEGSGPVQYTGPATELEGSLSGSGGLKVKLSEPAQKVSVVTKGSGDVALEGKTGELQARTAGSGAVHARALTARSAVLHSAGSGDVEATLEGGTLEASTTGSGDVHWFGQAQVERSEALGSGKVLHGQ